MNQNRNLIRWNHHNSCEYDDKNDEKILCLGDKSIFRHDIENSVNTKNTFFLFRQKNNYIEQIHIKIII